VSAQTDALTALQHSIVLLDELLNDGDIESIKERAALRLPEMLEAEGKARLELET